MVDISQWPCQFIRYSKIKGLEYEQVLYGPIWDSLPAPKRDESHERTHRANKTPSDTGKNLFKAHNIHLIIIHMRRDA